MRTKRLKEKITDTLELPRDIVLDVARVILIGNNQVTVENHKGIIEYSEMLIRVNTGSGILSIGGSNLNIKTIIQEEITITGEIMEIRF